MNADDFERLFKSQFPRLCAWCQYRFRFDIDQAKEVVHTAFIKLWNTRQTLDPALPVLSYLQKIVLHNSLDILRHEKVKEQFRQQILQQQATGQLQEEIDQFSLKKLQADIDAAIAELPPQMRQIFELSRYEGLKYADIAQRLNLSVNTVETQMSRALKKLRHRLSGHLSAYLISLILTEMTKN